MSVLVTRAHKRFAVRRAASLRNAHGNESDGLMIELSCEGCRISKIDSDAYTIDEAVTLELDDGEHHDGRVRWAHDGFVGIKFAAALRPAELGELLEASRIHPKHNYGT